MKRMAVICILKIITLVLISKISAFQFQPVYRTCIGLPPYKYAPREYYLPGRLVNQAYLPAAPSPPSPSNTSPNQSPQTTTHIPEEPQKPQFNSTILNALNSNLKNGTTGKIDSGVLNNLAIALQLLIVSNLLNSSPEIAKHANSTLALANEIQSFKPPLPYESPSKLIARYPDANFLGTSTLADPGGMSIYSGPYVPATSSHVPRHIKSPYEAIATPISPFDKYTTDFKSPYQSIMSQDTFGDDLFSF